MHKLIAIAPLLLAACSTVSASKDLANQEQASGGECRSEGLEGFAGREASAEVGTEILAKTGAKVLILPPSVGGSKGLDDYIGLLTNGIHQLAAAL